MACHEIAALRLGLMGILGRENEAEREHELAELGSAIQSPGPIQSLSQAPNLAQLKGFFEDATSRLEERVSKTSTDDPKLGYYRTLVILTKKVELELSHQIEGLSHLYRDLDEMHDLVHEVYPTN